MHRLLIIGLLVTATAPLMAADGVGGADLLPRAGTLPDLAIPPAPALSPQEALKTLRVDPAFRVELAAADPLVSDPVAITFDADGRMWVVEMRGYMPNIAGDGEKEPVGRVVVLTDRDGDGAMDERTVFLDGLVMPRAIAVVRGGVLIGEPPRLWFCTIRNDLTCGEKREVTTYAKGGSAEYGENGLLQGFDGWIYSANSARRLRFDGSRVVEQPTRQRGQWGISQDDYGRLYYNANSTPLWVDLFPSAYLERNSHLESRIGIGAACGNGGKLQSVRVNPGTNRAYQQGTLQADGRLASVTAIAGVGVYRGGSYPDSYRGDIFVPEPAANVVLRFVPKEKGIELSGSRVQVDDPDFGRREFLASTDERFRPVNVASGPDGCLYIVDLYRGILQHRSYLTPYLKKQIRDRGLEQPIGLGRIYRVVHKDHPPVRTPPLAGLSAAALLPHLGSANGWARDMAQRQLLERQDRSVIPGLHLLVATHRDHLARLQALWTLDGLDAVDATTITLGVRDAHPKVRAAALQVAHRLLARPDQAALLATLATLANDPEQAVRVHLMFCLGAAATDTAARAVMIDLLSTHVADKFIRQAALSGLKDREGIFLRELLADRRWQQEDAHRSALLRELAGCLLRSRDAALVNELLTVAAMQPADQTWRQLALLNAANDLPRGRRFEPIVLTTKPAVLATLDAASDPRLRPLLAAWNQVLAIGATPARTVHAPLSAGDQRLYDQGKALYAATCLACHQDHGKGLPGIAPPLADSPWAEGSEQRLIRIALGGIGGPLTVGNETFNLVMPGFTGNPLADDAGIAAILTYVRNAWGNRAPAVQAEAVRAVRAATATRTEPWTVEELLEVK